MVATIFVSIPIQQNNHRIFHTSHTTPSQLHYQFLFQFGIEIWGLTYSPKYMYLKVLMTPNTIFVTWILHDINNQVPKFLEIWAFR